MGGEVGGERAANLFSLTISCHRLKVEPYAYPCDIVPRLSSDAQRDIWELTPRGWRDRRAQAATEVAKQQHPVTARVTADRRNGPNLGQPRRSPGIPVKAICLSTTREGRTDTQTAELLEPMARVARMIEGHLEGILAHWTQGLTTALMEGINNLFSAVKSRARRYRTVE